MVEFPPLRSGRGSAEAALSTHRGHFPYIRNNFCNSRHLYSSSSRASTRAGTRFERVPRPPSRLPLSACLLGPFSTGPPARPLALGTFPQARPEAKPACPRCLGPAMLLSLRAETPAAACLAACSPPSARHLPLSASRGRQLGLACLPARGAWDRQVPPLQPSLVPSASALGERDPDTPGVGDTGFPTTYRTMESVENCLRCDLPKSRCPEGCLGQSQRHHLPYIRKNFCNSRHFYSSS